MGTHLQEHTNYPAVAATEAADRLLVEDASDANATKAVPVSGLTGLSAAGVDLAAITGITGVTVTAANARDAFIDLYTKYGALIDGAMPEVLTVSNATSTPVPVRIESPTDAEVLAQVNALATAAAAGSLHVYTTPTGNEIVFNVLDDGTATDTLILRRLTDVVRLYEVAVLPDPEHFQLTPRADIVERESEGYRIVDDGVGGHAWRGLGDAYSSSASASQVQLDRQVFTATAGQQIYPLPNTPTGNLLIVQIEGAGNNLDSTINGNNIELSPESAANVDADDTVVINYDF